MFIGATLDMIANLRNGYLYLKVLAGDEIVVQLDDSPYQVYASAKVAHLSERTAFMRGPLVYCMEGVDHEGDVLSIRVAKKACIAIGAYNEALQAITLTTEAERVLTGESLYQRELPKTKKIQATLIPYYTWCNRGENQMRVWIPMKDE